MAYPLYEMRGMEIPKVNNNQEPSQQFTEKRNIESEILRGISKLISRNSKPIKVYEFKSTKAVDTMNSSILEGPVYRSKV